MKLRSRLIPPLVHRLKEVDEGQIWERWNDQNRPLREKAKWAFLSFTLIFYHGLNGIVTIALYAVVMVLITPLMFVVWVLSLISGVPGIPATVNVIKTRLDAFLVGSLGDIKVFMDESVQASRVRGEMESALDGIHSDPGLQDADIYIIAHSTGAAIAYETLVHPSNVSRRSGVKGLITAGSIMRMVRKMASRRASFDEPLPKGVRWINFWTPYDPALAGPIYQGTLKGELTTGPDQNEVVNVPVSNEGDPFSDHSAYWTNEHQVIPRLVKELLGNDESPFDFGPEKELERVAKRKLRILALSGFRLCAWLALPVSLMITLWIGPWGEIDTKYWFLNWAAEEPNNVLETTIVVFLRVAAAFIVAQLLYRFYRALLWDGFLREAGIFRA